MTEGKSSRQGRLPLLTSIVVVIVLAGAFGYTYLQSSSTIASENSTITSLQSSLAAASSTITSLNSKISSLSETIKNDESAIQAAQSKITQLQAQVAQDQATITTLQNQGAAQQSQIAQLQSQVQSLNAQISSLQNQVASLQSQLSNLQNLVSARDSVKMARWVINAYFNTWTYDVKVTNNNKFDVTLVQLTLIVVDDTGAQVASNTVTPQIIVPAGSSIITMISVNFPSNGAGVSTQAIVDTPYGRVTIGTV